MSWLLFRDRLVSKADNVIRLVRLIKLTGTNSPLILRKYTSFFLLLFFKIFGGYKSFFGVIDMLFWTSGDVCPGFQSQVVSIFTCFLACVILRFTSGATTADCIEVSMANEPFWSMYLQMGSQALMEVWAGAQRTYNLCSEHRAVHHSATPARRGNRLVCVKRRGFQSVLTWRHRSSMSEVCLCLQVQIETKFLWWWGYHYQWAVWNSDPTSDNNNTVSSDRMSDQGNSNASVDWPITVFVVVTSDSAGHR